MGTIRPRIDVNNAIKDRAAELKKKLRVKTEAEAVAYLLALYEASNGEITVRQHEKFLEQAAEIVRQQTF